jgi:hypothetical protein
MNRQAGAGRGSGNEDDLAYDTTIDLTLISRVQFVVLGRHIVFGNFTGPNRSGVRIGSVFYSGHNPGFERLAFFEEFPHALRGSFFDLG